MNLQGLMQNVDDATVYDFGNEWDAYRQQDHLNLKHAFDQYFNIFPWELVDENSEGFDMGCGSGRWARFVAPNVGLLNCIDPSPKALDVAKLNLRDHHNCTFEQSIVEDCSLGDCSQDFGYCLGVLHHIPDTLGAMKSCVSKLKPGAPFLIYIYYRFDNRPFLFKAVWAVSDLFRKLVCGLPFSFKLYLTKVIAALVYYPLTRISLAMEKIGLDVANVPLSYYRDKSYSFMQTDALDKFGTRLEQRFTRNEIYAMMKCAGLDSIQFSDSTPFWVAVGFKRHA